MNKTIKYFALFLTWMLIQSAFGQTNYKPEAKPDTFRTAMINVLKNDIDLNNDSMKVAWFMGKPFIGKATLTKKDTGIFEITDKGWFYFTPDDRFYGEVKVYYHVNDVTKSGGGPATTKGKGWITCIYKPVIKGPFIDTSKCRYRVICSRSGCVDNPTGKYVFDLVLGGDTIKGAYAHHEKAYQRPDTVRYSEGFSKHVIEIYEYHYIMFYWPKTMKMECMDIPEDLYNYIRMNACRQ
jgi:hypothetical protein